MMGKKKRFAGFMAILGLFLFLAVAFSGYFLGKGLIAVESGKPLFVFGMSVPLDEKSPLLFLFSSRANALLSFLAVVLFCAGIFFFCFLLLRKKARRPLFSNTESSLPKEDDTLDFNPLFDEEIKTETVISPNPLAQELSLSINGQPIQTIPLRTGDFVLTHDGFRIAVSLEKTDK